MTSFEYQIRFVRCSPSSGLFTLSTPSSLARFLPIIFIDTLYLASIQAHRQGSKLLALTDANRRYVRLRILYAGYTSYFYSCRLKNIENFWPPNQFHSSYRETVLPPYRSSPFGSRLILDRC